MEQMLALSLLVLHGARAATLPASHSPQELQFHKDLSTGKPLTTIVGKDLKRMLTETGHQPPEKHKDQERHERHDRFKLKAMSMLGAGVEEVLQDPDDTELRNAVTQLIKEVENRHAKKHRTTETDTNAEDVLVNTAVDDQLDDTKKVDTHENALSQTHHNSNPLTVPKPNSDVIHFVSRTGLKQRHNDLKQNDVRHNSSNKHVNISDSSVANTDRHESKVVLENNGKTISGSNELLYSLNRQSNLSEDLNGTVVDQQVEQDIPTNADLKDGDEQIEKTVIYRSKSNEDPVSFASWGSDDYGDQYLSNDDEYDDLIDLRESKESIHFVESGDDFSYFNPNNNGNVLDHINSYNDEDTDVKDDNNNGVDIISKQTPQNDLNTNAAVIINDLLYNDIFNSVDASTSTLNSDNDLTQVLRADTATSNNNSHANESLRAGTPTESYKTEPETFASSELRQTESEIEGDTDQSHHHHHLHTKENGDSSEESDDHAENNSRGCRGHNKIYNLSFRF